MDCHSTVQTLFITIVNVYLIQHTGTGTLASSPPPVAVIQSLTSLPRLSPIPPSFLYEFLYIVELIFVLNMHQTFATVR